MKQKKKSTHGGKREGSGLKSRFKEPRKPFFRRVPVSKFDELSKMVDDKLESYAKGK